MRWIAGKPSAPIGIDVGGRCIKAVQYSDLSPPWHVEAAISLQRAGDNVPIDRSQVRQLADAMAEAGFQGNQVILAVPSDKLLTGIMALPPRQSHAPVEQLAQLELSRMHRCNPKSFEMACWDLPAPARAGEATYVMAAACPHSDANTLLDAFEAEGLTVMGLDIHASAVARACWGLLSDRLGIAAILDVGWNLARLVLLHQNIIVYVRKLNKCGLEALVSLLSTELKCDMDQAERLLFEEGLGHEPSDEDPPSQGPGQLHEAAAAHFNTMIEEMRIPLSYLANQYPDAVMGRLLLTGGGAQIPGLKEYLSSGIEVEVLTIALMDLARCSPQLQLRDSPAMTVAAGLGQFCPKG